MSVKTLSELLANASPDPKGPAATDPTLEGKCPMLYSLLTDKSVANGKARRTCSLTIFAADGVWKASLNERDRGMTLWASADQLQTLPEALEALLEETPVPWHISNFGGRGGNR